MIKTHEILSFVQVNLNGEQCAYLNLIFLFLMCSNQASQKVFNTILPTFCWISVFMGTRASSTGDNTRSKKQRKLLYYELISIIERQCLNESLFSMFYTNIYLNVRRCSLIWIDSSSLIRMSRMRSSPRRRVWEDISQGSERKCSANKWHIV